MILETETAYFDAHLDEWMRTYAGKIALVKGERLIGMFDTYEHALAEAARRFGLASFLMREVSRDEPRATLLAACAGQHDVDPPHSSWT